MIFSDNPQMSQFLRPWAFNMVLPVKKSSLLILKRELRKDFTPKRFHSPEEVRQGERSTMRSRKKSSLWPLAPSALLISCTIAFFKSNSERVDAFLSLCLYFSSSSTSNNQKTSVLKCDCPSPAFIVRETISNPCSVWLFGDY